MCHFFKKRVAKRRSVVVNTDQHRAQQIDRQSALQTSQKEKNKRILFTLTYHPHNLAAKNNILKNFKLQEAGKNLFIAPIDFVQTRQKHT